MKTIEFYSSIPGLADAFPIIPAKEYSAKWMGLAKQDYIDGLKNNTHPAREQHIYQCPGIFDMLNYGWIVPMWHDVMIKADVDRDHFAFMLPSEELKKFFPEKDLVGKHIPDLDKYLPKRPWSLKSVIKFNSPWSIIAPRGVKLLMLPLSYPDTFDFESATGILDPGYSNEINVQVYWNSLGTETLLKAGTPMCHIIPLSEEKFNFVCRDMTEHDEKWSKKFTFFRSMNFITRRNMIKDMYHKHFGKK